MALLPDPLERFTGPTGAPPIVVRAPGRINLIGDHTDYTGGLVLPMAIDRALTVVAQRSAEPVIEIYSTHFDRTARLDLREALADPDEPWTRYVAGVITLLARRGIEIIGARIRIDSDIPPGGGLASSAALEVGVALAMLELAGKRLTPMALASLCRRAERDYAGSPCGMMDQICCLLSRADHALLIDCRAMTTETIPLNLGGARLAVIDSGLRHAITGDQYAQRRRECTAALGVLASVDASKTALRDLSAKEIPAVAEHLDDTLLRRVKHVVSENERVVRATDALRQGDVETLGQLMVESHESLRDQFEVSCEELDHIVSKALEVTGVYGARMTGGGFGGCAIALVSTESIAALESAIHLSYNGRYESDATVFTVRSADAAGSLRGGVSHNDPAETPP